MLIGVNWGAPQSLPIIQRLLTENIADFCEIAIDNFIHLSPQQVRDVLPDKPVSFHILGSRFLEKTPAQLREIAERVRAWIAVFQPLYVSDHLLQFTDQKGYLPALTELDYASQTQQTIEHCRVWQQLIGQKIFFENVASLLPVGETQPTFYEQLIQSTQAGLLFDISNAAISDINGVCPFEKWQPLLHACTHFHVAGFRFVENNMALDTHDTSVAPEVHEWIRKILPTSVGKTLVVELDDNIDFSFWRKEILTVKESIQASSKLTSLNQFTSTKRNKEAIEKLMHKEVWHSMLNTVPNLKNDANDLFVPFFNWMQQKNISAGWALPLHIVEWFMHQSIQLTEDAKKALLMAAATRWAGVSMDHIAVNTILIASPHLPGIAVRLEKSAFPEKPGRITVVKISLSDMPRQNSFLLPNQDWQAVPL